MFDLTIHDGAKNGRFYEDEDGNFYPSVTNKTDKVIPTGQGLMNWAFQQNSKEEAEKYRQKRTKEGTRVHKACENLAKGHNVDLSDMSRNSVKRVQGFKKFWRKHQPSIIKLEFMLKSDTYTYAGTADMLAKLPKEDSEFALIDIKTSKSIYLSHKVQLMMYMQALEEHDIVSSDETNLYALHLKHRTKKGYHLKEIEYIPEIVEHFNKIYNHDFFDNGDLEPRFPKSLPDEIYIDENEDGGEFESGDLLTG